MLLTFCKNCSLKPALLGFFLLRGIGGAAAAAAAAKDGNLGSVVGCLTTTASPVAAVELDDFFCNSALRFFFSVGGTGRESAAAVGSSGDSDVFSFAASVVVADVDNGSFVVVPYDVDVSLPFFCTP